MIAQKIEAFKIERTFCRKLKKNPIFLTGMGRDIRLLKSQNIDEGKRHKY